MQEYRYGETVVQVHDAGYVHTILPDGTTVHSIPAHRISEYARAVSLGYGLDLWAMCKDHDRLHALLCFALDLPESPYLRQAGGELADAEEVAVLALQRFINLCRQQGLL